MKKGLIAVAITASILGACTSNSVKKAKISSTQDSVSYLIGIEYGSGVSGQLKTFPGGMNDAEFIDGFVTTYNGEESKISVENIQSYVMSFAQEAQAAEQDTNITIDASRLDSVSYVLGADYGSNIGEGLGQFPGGLNMEAFLDAFVTGFNGDSARIVVEDSRSLISTYIEKAQEKASKEALAKNKEYLDANAKNDSIEVTESGLQYKVIKSGNGEKPSETSTVKVHYHGMLTDGTVFDSSVDRGTPATFGVGQVIKGWTEALQLMSVGDKWTLYIPSELAYGANPPSPSIPANAILIFDVELLEIVK